MAKKTFVSLKNQKMRALRAKEHRHWTVEQWRKVIWSDESPFVYGYNCSQRIWVLKVSELFVHVASPEQ